MKAITPQTTDQYPLVPIVYGSGDASKPSPGHSGYGESVAFGVERYSTRPAQYYYRYAGCMIPKTGVVYVTCESAFFSRVSGEREQLILAYDQDVDGFRVLCHVTQSMSFTLALKEFQAFDSNQLAIEHAQRKAEKDLQAKHDFQQRISNGEDLF